MTMGTHGLRAGKAQAGLLAQFEAYESSTQQAYADLADAFRRDLYAKAQEFVAVYASHDGKVEP